MSIVDTMQAFASTSSHRLRASTASISVVSSSANRAWAASKTPEGGFQVFGGDPCNRWLEGRAVASV